MQLEDYLKSKSIKVTDFADKLGVKSKSTIYRIISGVRFPSPELMIKIKKATNGKVTANDITNNYEKRQLEVNNRDSTQVINN